MGSALSSGSNSPDDCSMHEFSSPSDTSWAQMHARVTKLPVNVVENLWADYRNLELNQAGRESVVSTDRLHPESKHALSFLSQRRTTDTITFLQLCSLYKWISNPLNETRAKGIGVAALNAASAAFHLHFAMRSAIFRKLFPGGSMDHGQLHALLRKTCPDDTEITIKRFADVFFAQMDTSREGVITEDKFLDWLMTSTPKVQFMVLEKLAPPETPPVPV
ncbi:uncharacterized protein LOC120846364 isoform X1 [Ixodes scapularis]|uniref:uncharacterized protein LOC120846364 isoform X1 n=1 Tax=Ixodes scapularis TaxID=6945 RepID=UPI001A9FEAFC|nr:uncharacterized protein LOC120846364 isoform X1 [Ixodes scapularis]